MADYDFSQYLSEVPDYESSTTLAERIEQAKAAANLAYDPLKQEEERQRKYNEMQNYNAQNKLNASQAGIDKTLQYNASQAKKANAINAAARGGGNADGLSAYLNNQTDTALAGQKLNIAAGLATDKYNQDQSYQQQDMASQEALRNIEANRGNAAEVYLTNMNNAEAERENAWKMNALNVANAIGSGAMTAEDINARLQMAADSIASQQYIAELGLEEAKLPWTMGMTPYQKDQSALSWTDLMGGLPGGESGSDQVGLSAYASSYTGTNAPTVNWDSSNGNVIIKNSSGATKTYTPETLTNMGAVLDNDRWKMAESTARQLLFNE